MHQLLREVLFPGLDLDSGLDWTLDWTLENMYFWCHCSVKEARGPMPCPLHREKLDTALFIQVDKQFPRLQMPGADHPLINYIILFFFLLGM